MKRLTWLFRFDCFKLTLCTIAQDRKKFASFARQALPQGVLPYLPELRCVRVQQFSQFLGVQLACLLLQTAKASGFGGSALDGGDCRRAHSAAQGATGGGC